MTIKPATTPDRTATIRLLIKRWEEKNRDKKLMKERKMPPLLISDKKIGRNAP